jgi:asparagine synthase (glutamine-hydrolysing)
MCGIAAVAGPNEPCAEILLRLLHRINHRGDPDLQNEASFSSNRALGTNRMAITSRVQGVQPNVSPLKAIELVFNGEVYNFQELATKCELNPQDVAILGDGYVLAAAVERWGWEALRNAEGMFATIWFNYRTQSICMARDSIGIKPLYYGLSNGTLFAASEIKSLCAEKQLNEVHEVPPGHLLEFVWDETGAVYPAGTKSFFDLADHPALDEDATNDDGFYATSLRQAIETSIKQCCSTYDGPIGVYLSGGIDSGAVYTLAKVMHLREVVGLTLGHPTSSDRTAALRLGEELGGEVIAGDCPSEESLFESVRDTIRIVESFEPNLVRQSSVQRLIARLGQRRGIRVVLCGEGADELFCGYPEFHGAPDNWQQIRLDFLRDLHRTQLQRVDRCSMAITTEVRVPYLARPVIELALRQKQISRFLNDGPDGIQNKLCLRQALIGIIPEWLRLRPKVVLSEGAGLRGNDPFKGMFATIARDAISEDCMRRILEDFPDWGLKGHEDALYFEMFRCFGYHKATFMKD